MLVTNQKWAVVIAWYHLQRRIMQMDKRVPMKGGDEYDGLTKARKFLIWKSGQLKKIKRAYNKRFRKHSKEIKDE
jgi:hypothetical protein